MLDYSIFIALLLPPYFVPGLLLCFGADTAPNWVFFCIEPSVDYSFHFMVTPRYTHEEDLVFDP